MKVRNLLYIWEVINMNNEQVVLVTGCSSGIGRDLCETLKESGYKVVASARDLGKLEMVSADLKLAIDVTHKESIERAVSQIMATYGRLDVLVNNAGYSTRGALEEVDMTEIKKMFDVNVFGMIQMIQAVVPVIRQRGTGKMIHIGSISGTFSQTLNGSYCASKYAVEAISDALRLELHSFQIQSTVIEPGAIQTPFFQKLEKNSDALMKNEKSPYYSLYKRDIDYRKTQKRADSMEVAHRICEIIGEKKLKPRYKVALALDIKIASIVPQSIREWGLLHH